MAQKRLLYSLPLYSTGYHFFKQQKRRTGKQKNAARRELVNKKFTNPTYIIASWN